MTAILLLLSLAACSPLKDGMYLFETTDLYDDTCHLATINDFPTWKGNTSWDDDTIMRVTRDSGDLILVWDKELETFSGDESFQETVADGCTLTEEDTITGTIPDKETLILDVVKDLDVIGSCGALAETRPCHYTLTQEGALTQ